MDVALANPLDYLDYRAFLRDRMQTLQSLNAKYSQRWFAKYADFNTPQLLSMIVAGKRNLTRDKIEKLGRALKLDERELEYFGLIVDMAHCSDETMRQSILRKLKASFKDGLFSEISDAGFEILRHWYLPAMRECLTLHDFKHDPRWFAKRLGIDIEEARSGLKFLEANGFIEKRNGNWVRSEPSIHTKNKVFPIVMANYHLQTLEQSFKAIRQSRDERYFECLTVAIPNKLRTNLIEKIQRFFREIDCLIEEQQTRDEVCQINLQFFKLSNDIELNVGGVKK